MSDDIVAVIPFRGENYMTVLMLRSLIDSINAIDRVPIVVVDDHSPIGADALDALAASRQIEAVLRMGAPRPRSKYVKDDRPVMVHDTSGGAAPALIAGVEWCRDRGIPYAWSLDQDSVILSSSVRDALDVLRRHDAVAVGNFFGGRRDWDAIASRRYVDVLSPITDAGRFERATFPYKSALRTVGYTPSVCTLFDTRRFFGSEIAPPRSGGWTNIEWFLSQIHAGRQTAFFPFFEHEHVAHLGGGVVMFPRDRPTFGNALGEGKYGGKHVGNYYAGYLQVPDTNAYLTRLESFYASGSASELVTRAWFTVPHPPETPEPTTTRLHPLDDACTQYAYFVEGMKVGGGTINLREFPAETPLSLRVADVTWDAFSPEHAWPLFAELSWHVIACGASGFESEIPADWAAQHYPHGHVRIGSKPGHVICRAMVRKA